MRALKISWLARYLYLVVGRQRDPKDGDRLIRQSEDEEGEVELREHDSAW